MENPDVAQARTVGTGCYLQEIYIKVWRSDRQQDWSVDINGERYENVASDVIGDLVDSALDFDNLPQPKTGTHSR